MKIELGSSKMRNTDLVMHLAADVIVVAQDLVAALDPLTQIPFCSLCFLCEKFVFG